MSASPQVVITGTGAVCGAGASVESIWKSITEGTSAIGPIRTPEEVAAMVVDAVEQERFLILTDPLAQTWMEGKTADIDRWLKGMRRMQSEADGA